MGILSNVQMLAFVAVTGAAVMLSRALTFVVFPSGKKTPGVILFLGDALPCALMALLVVYCLKSVSIVAAPHGIPELIAIAVVCALHIWKRNTLLSIIAGTVVYMVLVQMVF